MEVRFPDATRHPDGFESMRAILEDILPCHLDIQYVYWYITWPSWRSALPPGETLRSWGPPGRSWRRWCGLACLSQQNAWNHAVPGIFFERAHQCSQKIGNSRDRAVKKRARPAPAPPGRGCPGAPACRPRPPRQQADHRRPSRESSAQGRSLKVVTGGHPLGERCPAPGGRRSGGGRRPPRG